jgi:glutamine cyclotransferase
MWPAALLVPILAVGAAFALRRPPAPTPQPQTQAQAPVEPKAPEVQARKLSWRVVSSIAHDRNAFLQGLLWADGGFYESTGLEGQSSLRRLSADGKILKKKALPPDVFGEGLALWKNSLIQISWMNGRAWKWDAATFVLQKEWKYEGEGWGIASDSKALWMSDGSDTLFVRDPETFEITRRVPVTLNGKPLRNLNELEWIGGRVWANVWQSDTIVVIEPETGVASAFLDLQGILLATQRMGGEDVLNGIAYDAEKKKIWVGGKKWPRLFHIEVEGLD